MATLEVGRFATNCSACGRGTSPMEKSHSTIVEYSPNGGQPGCGEVFDSVRSLYIDKESIEAAKALRPDLEYIGVEL